MNPIALEPQATRGRSNCRCTATCAYCEVDLTGDPHEHDHFPRPHRHGGRTVVATCRRCHDMKDRLSIARLGTSLARIMAGESTGNVFLMHLCSTAATEGLPPEYVDGTEDDLIRRMVESSTTPEARVFAARVFVWALDCAAALEGSVAA